jgi:hypothetical protein
MFTRACFEAYAPLAQVYGTTKWNELEPWQQDEYMKIAEIQFYMDPKQWPIGALQLLGCLP